MSKRELTCIGCPLGCAIQVELSGNEVVSVTGNTCKRGEEYARKEVTHPTRIVTSTAKITGGKIPVVSVKTAQDIPKESIFKVMECINQITAAAPVKIGDVLCENAAGTGVNIIATRNVDKL